METETIKKALELIGEGANIRSVAHTLKVDTNELQEALVTYDGGFEHCQVELVFGSIGKSARRCLEKTLNAISIRLHNTDNKLGELTQAAAVLHKIYRDETDTGDGGDANDPISRLFGETTTVKQLKKR